MFDDADADDGGDVVRRRKGGAAAVGGGEGERSAKRIAALSTSSSSRGKCCSFIPSYFLWATLKFRGYIASASQPVSWLSGASSSSSSTNTEYHTP